MDELPVADVDADVREPPFVSVLEEDEIARLQVALGNWRPHRVLLGHVVRDVDAERVEDDPLGEPGAVERGRTRRRPDVGVADVLQRIVGDRLPGRATATAAGATAAARAAGAAAAARAAAAAATRAAARAQRLVGPLQVIAIHVAAEAAPTDRVEAICRRAGDLDDGPLRRHGRHARGETRANPQVEGRRRHGVIARGERAAAGIGVAGAGAAAAVGAAAAGAAARTTTRVAAAGDEVVAVDEPVLAVVGDGDPVAGAAAGHLDGGAVREDRDDAGRRARAGAEAHAGAAGAGDNRRLAGLEAGRVPAAAAAGVATDPAAR